MKSTKITYVNNNILLLHRWVVCLLPFCIVSGPFLADLFAIISSLIFVYITYTSRNWYYYNSRLFLIFNIWCFYLILSSLLSTNPLFSLESSLLHFRYGLFALSLWYIFENDQLAKKYFTISFLILFLLLLMDGYYQYFTGYNIFGSPYNYSSSRLTGLFGDNWVIGNFFSRTLPILFALIIMSFRYSKITITLMMFMLISVDVLIYLSGERSAFISLILGSIIIITLSNRWKLIRAITLILSSILIIFISVTDNKLKERMIDQTFNQANFLGDSYIPDHELLFKSAFNMFLDSPIYGVGPKMFRKLCHKERYYFEFEGYNSCSTHPHHSYLQLLAETGLLGTLPVIFLFAAISLILIRHFIRKIFDSGPILTDIQICLYTAIIITLWPLNVNMNFFGNWMNVIYFLPIGILFSTYKKAI